jgi:hypothetical protein
MAKKHSFLLAGLITLSALSALALLLTAPSWSSSALLSVTTTAPENLPAAGNTLTLRGGGFSQTTQLWLVPERSLRSATTATLETYGNPHHFIRRDDHLYVANGVGGFFIVQGLQSSVPFISGTLDSGGQGVEVALHRDEALLAAGNSGLQIIDIRDDANPQLLAVLNSLAPALSVASSGKIAYVAAGKAGVAIVDLADPRHPRHLGKLTDLPAAYKLSCDEKILVIATASGGWIYDVSQPERPRRLAALPVPGGRNTVMVRQGETLYWATKSSQESRLYALDLSRPASPRLLSSVPLIGVPVGISGSEEQLAVALESSGTQLFALGDGPRLVGGTTINAKSRTHYALLLGNDLWIADSGGELLRLDAQGASALTAPPLLPTFSPRINPIVTPQLFFLGNKTGLSIYDRGDDSAPILLARLPITGLEQQYLSADQRQLWLSARNDTPATTGKLLCVDISLPHAPGITAEIPFSHPPLIIGEAGTTLVISTRTQDQPLPLNRADKLDALHLINTALPQSPVLLSTYPLAAVSTGVSMMDHFVVLMQPDGFFRVIDVNAAAGPQETGSLQMPWLQTADWSGHVNIVVKDGVAFVSSLSGRIVLIDLRDPRQPKNLGGFTLAGPVTALLISDHFLLAEVNKEGLVVIDVKNIRAPEILGTIPLPGHLHNIAVQGEMVWYSNNDGNGIWPLTLPRRLQSSVADDQLVASLAQPPPPGAYRFWLTDAQKHLLVPGVSWSRPQ